MAAANVYRFSSKEIHPNSGLYYYGFRFYDPTPQRWLNRDPIFESGGINLYGFVANSPANYFDTDGRAADVFVDVGSACASAYDLYNDPSWKNAGFLAWDVAAAAVPGVPGSWVVKASKLAKKAKAVAGPALRLPFKDPNTRRQIEAVIDSMDRTKSPPAGVWQGGRPGHPQGDFLNDKGKLPQQPPGYYKETDVWPGSPGNRGPERLVCGDGGEVYYSPNHYEDFIRIR